MLHQVGVGALGPVFRTYEPTRDRLVAVKVFRLDITPEQAQSLADALAVAADAGLFHPSIVEPIAAGVEGTVAYRAEEYVAAESLDVALRHYAPAAMSRVLPFIAQLAGAIDFARTSGVGHGALHPRDIFVTPDDARATGFGVVEALERVGLRAPVRRPYSAPERVAGGAWGTPADVFSLAVIAYELLTSRRPAGTGSQIGSLSGTGVGCDSSLLVHAVLARAMDEDPRQRYPTALQFASALDAASQGRQPEPAAVAVAAPHVAGPPGPPAAADDEDTDVDDLVADDIAAERDADEAHLGVGVEEDREEDAAARRTLFEDDSEEAVEDLALDPRDVFETERFADEFSAADREDTRELDLEKRALDLDRKDEEADRAEHSHIGLVGTAVPALGRYSAPEPVTSFDTPSPAERAPFEDYSEEVVSPNRTGPSWTVAAIMIVLALLVGFVAGQMIDADRRTDSPETGEMARSGAAPAAPQTPTITPPVSAPATQPSAPSRPGAEAPPPVAEAPPATAVPAPAPAKPEPPRTGTLNVRSSPSGASVTVDGRWRGRTPLTLEGIRFGSHEVRVVQQGYTVATEDVTLSSSAPVRSLSFRLQRTARATAPPARSSRATAPPPAPKPGAKPESFTGSIYVDSRPRGARVFINGRAVGTTPVLVPDVPVGSQVVRLELENHRTWTAPTRVVSGQQAKVTGSLEPIK